MISVPGGRPTEGRTIRAPGRRQIEALLSAGRVTFGELGYAATRVTDITQRAGTSHASFYTYFANKEDLFRVLAGECAEALDAVYAGARQPAADLRAWLGDYLRVHRDHAGTIRAWNEGGASDPDLHDLASRARSNAVTALAELLGAGSRFSVVDRVVVEACLDRVPFIVSTYALPSSDEAVVETVATLIERGFSGA
jgi:AcrR family transcriptional regulator